LQKNYTLEQVAAAIHDNEYLITVQEAVTMIPLRIGTDVWFASKEGIVQRKATPEDIQEGIIIPSDVYCEIDVSEVLGAESTSVQEGSHILSPETFSQIARYQNMFAEKGIMITSLKVTEDSGKSIAYTQEGFAVFFTPWKDAVTQGDRLARVLAEATPQSYVDIRFGERVYVK
jgi:hypothetical protein